MDLTLNTGRKAWNSASLLVGNIVSPSGQNEPLNASFLWGNRFKQFGQYESPVCPIYSRAQFWYGTNSCYLRMLSVPDVTLVSSRLSNIIMEPITSCSFFPGCPDVMIPRLFAFLGNRLEANKKASILNIMQHAASTHVYSLIH